MLGDILDVAAEYFVSSGNPWFNLSGGVNAALRDKYGDSLQEELHAHLVELGVKAVPAGFCYKWKQGIGSYKGVVYAVTVDPFYDSSRAIVEDALLAAFRLLQPEPNTTVVFPAISTGYGRLPLSEFGPALRSVSDEVALKYPQVRFQIVMKTQDKLDEIRQWL